MSTASQDAATIARTANAIGSLDAAANSAAEARQGLLTKPPGSLGRLEALATRIAAITGHERPRLDARLIVVAAGDHGVVAQGVSPYPQTVTAQMVANFLRGGAAINVLARHARTRVRVVDAGVATPLPSDVSADPSLLRLGLATGAARNPHGPARYGPAPPPPGPAALRLLDDERRVEGLDIVGCGEMGIGNTTSAAALIAATTGRAPVDVTGRGTGADDETYARKLRAVERAIEVNGPDPADGIGLLASLGGYEIGVLAGVYLAAASMRVPAVMDGVISGAAALVAATIAPGAAEYVIAAHQSAEPGHAAVLDRLGLEPLLDLGMRLGEGSGAALGISLCVAACRLLDEMATFGEAGVDNSDAAVAPEA
ncbi:MAG: nicotinate-nucleotide--dimethylbenzimidazole phosphoribosyltransferase [Chloroflexi bacterium]|nr:nicotinate-nucleotide--dimethylbenzimidazole phosphoribosyltransferase [Chloroflexota bacterium]